MYRTSYHDHGLIVTNMEREVYEEKAKAQDEHILEFFRSHPGKSFTPWEVNAICLPEAPITSIRRAMTNLTNKGHLRKDCMKKREGNFGIRTCTWSLVGRYEQGKLF